MPHPLRVRAGDTASAAPYERSRISASQTARAVLALTSCFSCFYRDRPVYGQVKRWLECGLACVLLVLTSPLILLAALLMKLTSRGPAFYVQSRVGMHGRVFTLFKIRTMIHNCESITGPRWAIPGDPRITSFGYFLRVTHIDELPQLFNVIRGDMSLIGPRPERPEFVRALDQLIPGYRYRLLVRPGISGLAQVQHAPDTGIDSVRWKLLYDLFYIAFFDLWLDWRIFAATLFRVVGVPFRVARRICGVPDKRCVARAIEECDTWSAGSPAAWKRAA